MHITNLIGPMNRSIAFFILLLTFISPINAQPGTPVGTPDTLNHMGYYPLEVGNVWEWKTERADGFIRLDKAEVVGDTVLSVGGAASPFFVLQTNATWENVENGETGMESQRLWLQYIFPVGGGAVIMARELDTNEEVAYTTNLGYNFSLPLGGFESIEGGYAGTDALLDIGADQVPYAAVKQHIVNAEGEGYDYYHGIGRLPRLGTEVEGGVQFTYAVIGGVQYGLEEFIVSVEDEDPTIEAPFALYP